jgi:hypothetical protein
MSTFLVIVGCFALFLAGAGAAWLVIAVTLFKAFNR